MATKYTVEQCIYHDKRIIPVGESFEVGDIFTVGGKELKPFTEKQITIFLDSGFLSKGKKKKSPKAKKTTVTKTESKKKPVPKKEDTIKHPKSKWNLDPKNLEGLSLDVLNDMVQERDPKLDSFNTEAEAIALLTMDFE